MEKLTFVQPSIDLSLEDKIAAAQAWFAAQNNNNNQ